MGALTYRDLVSQRFHPDFQEAQKDIELGLIEEDNLQIQWGAWQPSVENNLVFDDSLSPQQRLIAQYELVNLYPWVPHCVEPTVDPSFSVNWYMRSTLGDAQEIVSHEQSYRRTLPSQIQNTSLFFEKTGPQNYIVDLVLSDQSRVELQLPICN